MTNQFYNGTALPASKSDITPLPVGTNPATYWTANDFNTNLGWLAETQSALQTLEYDAQNYGAVPDGVTDCTAVLNGAYTYALAQGRDVVLRLSRGTSKGIYRITAPLQIGPMWVDEKDISITTPDPATVPSYNGTLAAAAIGKPIVHVLADPGVVLKLDGTFATDTAAIRIGTRPEKWQPNVLIENLTITSSAGMDASGNFLPNSAGAPSTNVCGIFGASTRVTVRNCNAYGVKRGLILCACYWSKVDGLFTFWTDRGYVHPGANATNSDSITHNYAATTGTEISGQGFGLRGNYTEQCATSLYVPQADGFQVDNYYWEATGTGLTDYQLKLGDGTATVTFASFRAGALSAVHGKTARFKNSHVSFYGSRFYDQGTDGSRALQDGTIAEVYLYDSNIPFSTATALTTTVMQWPPTVAAGTMASGTPIPSGSSFSITIAASGMPGGSEVYFAGFSLPTGWIYTAYASADQVVTVVALNVTGSSATFPSRGVQVFWNRGASYGP